MSNGKISITANALEKHKAEARDNIAMLEGAPPYNTWSNLCYGDGYFANSLLRQYKAESIEQLKKWCNYGC